MKPSPDQLGQIEDVADAFAGDWHSGIRAELSPWRHPVWRMTCQA